MKENRLDCFIKKIMEYVLPIVFFLSIFANMSSFYVTLGNRNEAARQIVSWGIILVIFLMSVYYLFRYCVKSMLRVRIMIIPLILLGALIIAVCRYKFELFVVKKMVLFFLYCVPAFAFALFVGNEKKEREMFKAFVWIGMFLTPGYIMFMIDRMTFNPERVSWSTFGGMDYLSIAYSALFISEGVQMAYWLNDSLKCTKWKWVCLLEVGICALAIMFSGARGPLLGGIICCGVNVLIFICKKVKYKWNYCLAGFGVLVMILSWIVVPAEMLGGGRTAALIGEIKDGTLSQAVSSQESDAVLEKIENSAAKGQGIKETVSNEKENMSEEEKAVVKSITNGSMSRVFLYRLSFKEIKANPLLGMGPVGFEQKYGNYPHNFVLELCVDLGIPILLLGAAYCIVCFGVTFYNNRKDIMIWAVTMLCIAFGVQMVLSGSIYVCPVFVWIVTYFSRGYEVLRQKVRGK